ncbi:MAG TPA: FAD-dependent oxidoreductase [Burkholderiales bacterium]|nr:FAD-dependent oxidoreductase [Burkholderiales bacterium]
MSPIVIVGTGLAGYSTARELRKHDKESPLVIVTGDDGQFYSKPMISNAFASNKTAETLPINSAEQMAKQVNAQIRTRTCVTAIAPAEHRIAVGTQTIEYSQLVLALGADQIRLPLAGDAADAPMSVNDLVSYARFRTAIEGKRDVVILGAGLIGCEFANDLALSGYGVDLIDIAPQPLGRLLPAEGGAFVQRQLAAIGVKWHLGTSAQAVERDGGRLRVRLANGEALHADAVLSAIGLKPRTALAQAAGLAVNRGIVTDRQLRTSVPDIYALGDCAEVEGLVLPFIMPIMHAARVCAANLAGKAAQLSYPAMPVIVKTPACPTLVAPPAAGAAGEWRITAGDDGVKSLFVDAEGKLLGMVLQGAAMAERQALSAQLPPVLK